MEQGKYISAKAIIGSIITDFGISSTTFGNDIIGWIGDAISAIPNETVGYEIKYFKTEVKDFKLPIPQEAVTIYNVFHNGIPLLRGFKKHSYDDINIKGFDYLQTEYIQRVNANVKMLKLQGCSDDPNCIEENRRNLVYEILEQTEQVRKDHQFLLNLEAPKDCYAYDVTPYCIKTNLDTGYLTIQYSAFATDDDGFPLVKDTYNYKEFVKFFCMMKLLSRGIKHPVFDYPMVLQLQREFKIKATNESKGLTDRVLDDFTSKWGNLIHAIDFSKPYYQN